MNRRSIFLLGVLLIAFSSQAFAEAEAVFFVGAGEADVEKDVFNGTDTAIKIGTGFRVTESSGVEIYWTKYGKPEDERNVPSVGNRNVVVQLHSVSFQYVRFFPLANSIELLGRIGLSAWVSEYDIDNYRTFDDDGIDWIVGAGAQIEVIEDWPLRMEWEYTELHNFKVSFLSVGIAHYFD
ncbi:outer membrane beta-barrel protein [Kaarinaea lacus]